MDENFTIIASQAVAHGMDHPHPNHFEHDAEKVWWKDFCEISKALIKKSSVDCTMIRSIGASALVADSLPEDEHCVSLRKAILYGIIS